MHAMTTTDSEPPRATQPTLALRFRPLRVELEDPAALRALRALRHLDQAGLGDALGVPRQYVSLWERGKSLSLADALALARTLGVPVEFVDDADAA